MRIFQYWKAQLLVEYSKDRKACEVLEGTHADEHYHVMDEAIYYKGCIYLVPSSQLRDGVLQAVQIHHCLDTKGSGRLTWLFGRGSRGKASRRTCCNT